MTSILKKSELAELGGVSRQAMNGLTKGNGQLAPAVTESGKVDASHPAVVAWLSTKGVAAPSTSAPAFRDSPAMPVPGVDAPEPSGVTNPYDIEDLEDLTLRQVVMRFGSLPGFKQYVDAIRHIADYKQKELKVREMRGDLVRRSLVTDTLLPLIDTAFSRLVSDTPDALAKRVLAIAQAEGADALIPIVQEIREANARILKECKDSAAKLQLVE